MLALAGEAHLRARQFTQAAELFQNAAALRPDAAGLHTGLALSSLGTGENGRAVAELERAASLDKGTQRAGILLTMSYLRARAPDKAMAAVVQMEKNGSNPLVQNLKGGVHLAKQDLAGARASFEEALKLDPLYMPALDNLAQLDTMEKRPGGARQRYMAALARSPGNPLLMEALARLAAAEGKTGEARQWLARALNDNPDDLRAGLRLVEFDVRAGDKQKALVLAQKIQTSHPANVDARAMLAHVSYANDNFAAAAEEYARLTAMSPNNAGLHARYATVQMSMEDMAGAEASLRKALSIAPDMTAAQLSLLNVLIAQKKFPAALSYAKTVQEKQPASASGFKYEGDVHGAQGMHAAAVKAYERAFVLQQSSALVTQLHGALTRAGKAGEAKARITGWLGQHPGDIATRMYFASGLLLAKDVEAGAEHLHAVLRFDPANVMALNDLAWASQQLKRKDALSYAERAYKLAPNNAAVLDTLGWILMDNGETRRALPLLKNASALAPGSSDIRFHYGAALAKSGDKRSARAEIERAMAGTSFTHKAEAKALLATL
ncbi:PEP-CTERM system TPR-repeat protein PrsT [Massilia cavernae]|uniref:PEP-CTERM system TPR-repeat protein PrsT n=1 Tax=Massilia cavernae TaxID=2320864 RepID=A0A418Y8E5_9BURK|nr:PEP-CTERM system TPR-repeat protein PrsT [Massilia cavernae]